MKKQGFSFVEVLVALTVLALLSLVVGSSVTQVLRAEEQGRAMRRMARVLPALQTAHELALPVDARNPWMRSEWRWTEEGIELDDDEGEMQSTLYTIMDEPQRVREEISFFRSDHVVSEEQ